MNVYKKNRDELIEGLEEMLHNLSHIKEISDHFRADIPQSVIHYVGMNYQLHIEVLRTKQYPTTADLYEKRWIEAVKK